MFKKLYYVLLALLLSASFAVAQPKGKPNLKPYKEEKKRANKGDYKANLILGNVCKGNIYDSNPNRDYLKAELYLLNSVINPDSSVIDKGEKSLVQIYLTGGYGINKDLLKARTWFEKWLQKNNPEKQFLYAKDLNISTLFNEIEANPTDAYALIRIARYMKEFDFSYTEAIRYLDLAKAADSTNTDVPYLRQKWQKERELKLAALSRTVSEDEYKSVLVDVMQNHVNTSMMAKLEYVHSQYDTGRNMNKLSETRTKELLASFITDAQPDHELRSKAIVLIMPYLKGKARVMELRKLAQLRPNPATANLAQTKALLEELRQTEEKFKTLEGWHQYGEANADAVDMVLKVKAFRQNFGGELSEFLKMYRQVEALKKNADLIGMPNIERISKEVLTNFEKTLESTGDIYSLLRAEKFIQSDEFYLPLRPTYDTLLVRKLHSFNLSDVEILFHKEKMRIEETNHKTLSQWQSFYVNYMKNPLFFLEPKKPIKPIKKKLPPKKEVDKVRMQQLGSFIKEKAIRSVYGTSPTLEQLDKMKYEIASQKWLQPEGNTIYWNYTQDSEYSFTGKVYLGNVLYHYSVVNVGTHYTLEIKSVKDKQANLVYQGNIKIDDKHASASHAYVVNIYASLYKKFRWQVQENDYLQVIYKESDPHIEVFPVGNIRSYYTNTHGLSAEQIRHKESPADFSGKTAIKSALRYFILEYNRLLGM